MQANKSINFCVVGHVDHGKSTCFGIIYAMCGGLDEHELHKIHHDATTQKWSKIFDILEEEQVKGKTHEYNIMALNYCGQPFKMIDTPGHKLYIGSLIAGITQFNLNEMIGCLIVSIKKGEFDSGWTNGQTKEDILICRAAGITNMIVLINKMDSVDWNMSEYSQIVDTVKKFCASCRFKELAFLPISGFNGIGLIPREKISGEFLKVFGEPTASPSGQYFMDTLLDFSRLTPSAAAAAAASLPLEFNIFECRMQILKVVGIITVGFSCIAHYSGEEYKVEIVKTGKQILKSGDADESTIIKTNPPMINKNNSNKIILRTGEATIGYAIIKKASFIKKGSQKF